MVDLQYGVSCRDIDGAVGARRHVLESGVVASSGPRDPRPVATATERRPRRDVVGDRERGTRRHWRGAGDDHCGPRVGGRHEARRGRRGRRLCGLVATARDDHDEHRHGCRHRGCCEDERPPSRSSGVRARRRHRAGRHRRRCRRDRAAVGTGTGASVATDDSAAPIAIASSGSASTLTGRPSESRTIWAARASATAADEQHPADVLRGDARRCDGRSSALIVSTMRGRRPSARAPHASGGPRSARQAWSPGCSHPCRSTAPPSRGGTPRAGVPVRRGPVDLPRRPPTPGRRARCRRGRGPPDRSRSRPAAPSPPAYRSARSRRACRGPGRNRTCPRRGRTPR